VAFLDRRASSKKLAEKEDLQERSHERKRERVKERKTASI